MPRMTLYSGTKNASSWAMRAWLALKEAGLEFEEVVVDIRRPQRFVELAEVARFSPSSSVPVLDVEGMPIFDSLAIMEFANDMGGDQLWPANRLARGRARAVAAWQHSGLTRICHRISFESSFYPFKRQLTRQELEEAAKLFGFLQALLQESGGPFLFGKVSLADLALAPTAIRLGRHIPVAEMSVHAATWVVSVSEHSGVAAWMAEADGLPHIWSDEYLAPGETTPDWTRCPAASLPSPVRELQP